MMTDAVATVTF